MKTKNNYRNKVRNGTLHQSVVKLLNKEFPKLEKQIQEYLNASGFDLKVFMNKANTFDPISSWSLSIDFDEYQWSYKLTKPHWIQISIALEGIENKEERYKMRTTSKIIEENNTLIIAIAKFVNSFELHSADWVYDPERNFRETHISLVDLEDKTIILKEIEAIKTWIKTIYAQFVKGIDTIDRNDLISYSNFDQIYDIKEKIKTLKNLDKTLSLFGSEKHKYELNPTISKEELIAFETKHQLIIPEGHRHFLLDIGNGGAGPYYGLEPLENGIYDYIDQIKENEKYKIDLSKKFPHKKAWNFDWDSVKEEDWDSFREENENEYFPPKWINGLLKICNFGCGVHLGLVVNGNEYGTIWVDDRCNDNGIYPDPYFDQKEEERTTFLDWYEMWLDRSIKELENSN